MTVPNRKNSALQRQCIPTSENQNQSTTSPLDDRSSNPWSVKSAGTSTTANSISERAQSSTWFQQQKKSLQNRLRVTPATQITSTPRPSSACLQRPWVLRELRMSRTKLDRTCGENEMTAWHENIVPLAKRRWWSSAVIRLRTRPSEQSLRRCGDWVSLAEWCLRDDCGETTTVFGRPLEVLLVVPPACPCQHPSLAHVMRSRQPILFCIRYLVVTRFPQVLWTVE